MENYTVAELIAQLQKYEDPNEKIIFQYFTAGYASQSKEAFSKIAGYLMENEQFGEDTANVFLAWVQEAEGVLREAGELN